MPQPDSSGAWPSDLFELLVRFGRCPPRLWSTRPWAIQSAVAKDPRPRLRVSVRAYPSTLQPQWRSRPRPDVATLRLTPPAAVHGKLRTGRAPQGLAAEKWPAASAPRPPPQRPATAGRQHLSKRRAAACCRHQRGRFVLGGKLRTAVVRLPGVRELYPSTSSFARRGVLDFP
jgi:hypothetical protein